MPGNHKCANWCWQIDLSTENRVSHSDAQLAVLMDIRHELQRLNTLLHCSSFVGISRTLEKICRNTTRKRRAPRRPTRRK